MFLCMFQIAVIICAMKITHLKHQKLHMVFLYDTLVKEIVPLFPTLPVRAIGLRSVGNQRTISLTNLSIGILQYSLLFSYTLPTLLLIAPLLNTLQIILFTWATSFLSDPI